VTKLSATSSARSDLASERDRAREGLDCARSKWSAAVDTHAGHVKQEQEMTATVVRLVEDRTRLANERDGIETLLSPVMSWQSDWVVAARQNPEGFLENCQGRAQEFEACQRRLATAVEKLTTLARKPRNKSGPARRAPGKP
jgi:uncharacterized protein (DUF3084 family)